MKHRTLIYFEDDLTESFGITDLRMMSRYFERTMLFSENKVRNKNVLPPEVVIVENYIDWKGFSAVSELLRNLPLVITTILKEGVFSNIRLGRLLFAIKKINTNIYKAKAIKKHVIQMGIEPNQVVWYSFWFYDCLFQAMLKKEYPSSLSVIRTHAGDLFEDSPTLQGKTLIRNFQLSYTDKCVSISDAGTQYLKKKYPVFTKKFICSRLGTQDPGIENRIVEDRFVVVSCSHVRNVKRVHLIAEALFLVDFEVEWYHFGNPGNRTDADLFIEKYHTSVEKLSSSKNIKFQQMGNLPIEEVMKFYAENPVNLLLSTSSTEGIPVSMMEAASFGIPIMGTDVGGCNEIITANTGILLNPEITPEQIADKLREFRVSDLNTITFRKKVREFWEQNFNREVNYKNLTEQLQEMEI